MTAGGHSASSVQDPLLTYINNFCCSLRWQLVAFDTGFGLHAPPPPEFRERVDAGFGKVYVAVDDFRLELLSAVASDSGLIPCGESVHGDVAQERFLKEADVLLQYSGNGCTEADVDDDALGFTAIASGGNNHPEYHVAEPWIGKAAAAAGLDPTQVLIEGPVVAGMTLHEGHPQATLKAESPKGPRVSRTLERQIGAAHSSQNGKVPMVQNSSDQNSFDTEGSLSPSSVRDSRVEAPKHNDMQVRRERSILTSASSFMNDLSPREKPWSKTKSSDFDHKYSDATDRLSSVGERSFALTAGASSTSSYFAPTPSMEFIKEQRKTQQFISSESSMMEKESMATHCGSVRSLTSVPSSLDLDTEEEERGDSGRCVRGVVNPNWPARLAWDLNTMLLVLFDAMVLPFQMAYKEGQEPDDFDTFWLWTTTTFFACDIVLNFFTGYSAGKRDTDYEPGRLVTSKVRIARNYARSWLPIDVVSTVPWGKLSNMLLGGDSAGAGQLGKLTKVVKFVRFMRLMRMLRLAKLATIWERIEAKCGSIILLQGVGLLRVLFMLVSICHWNACIWWMIGQPRNIFVELMSAEAQAEWEALPHWTTIDRRHGPEEPTWTWLQMPMADAYIFCFYWTLGVMRTMPAEVTPITRAERVYIMIFMFFAFSAFAICVAQITQTFFKFSERKNMFNADMAAVRMHLRKLKASEAVQMKIKLYLRHLFDTRRIQAKEISMMGNLPGHLKVALIHASLIPHLEKIHIFRGLSMRALGLLADCTDEKHLAPGDLMSVRDAVAEATWVLIIGRLQVVTTDLRDGDNDHNNGLEDILTTNLEVVDEETLGSMHVVRSKYTVVSMTASTIARVDKARFFDMYAKHPNLFTRQSHKTRGGHRSRSGSTGSTNGFKPFSFTESLSFGWYRRGSIPAPGQPTGASDEESRRAAPPPPPATGVLTRTNSADAREQQENDMATVAAVTAG